MKKEKVLIACSGGPDSMALLDMYKDKKNVFVCHVNYHKRPSANRDEKIVRKYCKKWGIAFYKFDYKISKKGNFQKLARDFRYDCFAKVCKKNNINVVYTAHHMDDNIETYFMQIKRNTSVDCYGIAKRIIINGVNVYRPLINKTKMQLVNYDIKKGIEYGIDESNNTDIYERNKVRHNRIDKMTYEDKRNVITEINQRNRLLSHEIKQTESFIRKYKKYPFDLFISFKYFDRLIRILLYKDMSSKYIIEIKKALSSKNNIEIKVRNKFICKEYGFVYIYDFPTGYKYKIYSLKNKSFQYFKLAKKGDSKSGACIQKDDLPLTVRNFVFGDCIKMPYGTKHINRFFIDNKISSFDRKIWPIVLNKNGEVILVPGIGCNKEHFSKRYNLYVLKLS